MIYWTEEKTNVCLTNEPRAVPFGRQSRMKGCGVNMRETDKKETDTCWTDKAR